MVINLTPHSIIIVDDNGEELHTIEASDIIARVSVSTERVGEVDGIPVSTSVFGDVEDLPAPVPGTIFIVSRMVAVAASDRNDLYIPNETVRDEAGRIIGCRSLAQV